MQSSAVSQRVDLVAITRVFLKIGAMSYGGPAIVGIRETEIQERRHWISKREFIEGLALVNMLPGPLVTQLGIFIGHTRRGLAGGILAGVSFLLPAFLIMVALAAGYARFGAVPAMRNAFYGIGPVVLGI
jgi:chromate transporter